MSERISFIYVVEIGIIPLNFSSWLILCSYIYIYNVSWHFGRRELTKPCPFFWWVLKQWVSFSLRFGFVLTSSKERGTELEWWRLNQPMNKPKDECNFKFIFDIFKFIFNIIVSKLYKNTKNKYNWLHRCNFSMSMFHAQSLLN